ncbi:MAG: hypothetical protein P8Y70_20480, partial [Candidatus Lokiarchaeota archaeon]
TRRAPIKNKIFIWILFILNLLFTFIIGFSLPLMTSPHRNYMPIVMLPLLIILNYIIIDRFHYYTGKSVEESSIEEFKKLIESNKVPVIEYEKRKYVFSKSSIILLAIGAPISAYLIYLFFDLRVNYWLHEIVTKQTDFFLNFFINMNTSTRYAPTGKYDWHIVIPGRPSIYFALIFYVVNIIRMIIQLWLYYIGYAWNDIHYSISAASSFIAAIIVLLMHRWNPEFILSFIYTGALFKRKFKKSKVDEEMDKGKKEEIQELKME